MLAISHTFDQFLEIYSLDDKKLNAEKNVETLFTRQNKVKYT